MGLVWGLKRFVSSITASAKVSCCYIIIILGLNEKAHKLQYSLASVQ